MKGWAGKQIPSAKGDRTVIELIGEKTKNLKMHNVNKRAISDKIAYSNGAMKDAVQF